MNERIAVLSAPAGKDELYSPELFISGCRDFSIREKECIIYHYG
jgi:hypothetical protein